MFKYKLIIAYDGTQYGGWQIQPNSVCIQELIQRALKTALRQEQEVSLVGSGRTDAGVHARGQVAHFNADTCIGPFPLRAALNGLLPTDIRILHCEPAEEEFHARYSAKGKIYHYHLHLERVLSPFKRLYSTHIRYPIDIPLLQEAARHLIGTHDFTSFANEAHKGSAANKPIKTIERIDVIYETGGVRLELQADGFLYKMVRNIVGTLLEVGAKQRQPREIPSLISAKDRKLAGMSAPPEGLFLYQVLF